MCRILFLCGINKMLLLLSNSWYTNNYGMGLMDTEFWVLWYLCNFVYWPDVCCFVGSSSWWRCRVDWSWSCSEVFCLQKLRFIGREKRAVGEVHWCLSAGDLKQRCSSLTCATNIIAQVQGRVTFLQMLAV